MHKLISSHIDNESKYVGKYFTYGGDCMGKISDKDSYKNMKTATKSSQFYATKQAAKKAKENRFATK